MIYRILAVLSAGTLCFAACKTPQSNSALQNVPQQGGNGVEQGGVVENQCDQGGHAGVSEGTGWPFNPKEGCLLKCKNEEAAKQDFVYQLRHHRVYGHNSAIKSVDPNAASIAKMFMNRLRQSGLKPNTFANITRDKVVNAREWREAGLKPGDILLNFNFGQPNHAGIFYSKRGISHARLVVDVNDNYITTFDGGWQRFTKIKMPNAQSLWLRPRAEFLKDGDLDKLVQWANTMEPSPYDNTLVDDWKEFRVVLHKLLDENMSSFDAREQALAMAKEKGWAPYANDANGPDEFMPPSGIYCSEGTAGIYSYLGFRQYGETAIDMITTFSKSGEIPDWKLYEDALSGFGADSDRQIYMMHKLFYNYFQVFDQARQMGAIQIPGISNPQQSSFAEAITANMKAVEADGGASNHVETQLDALQGALTQAGQSTEQLQQLRQGLVQATGAVSQSMGRELNLTQAVYALFYANKAYGPHSFFENGKHFELMGVFYNTIVKAEEGQRGTTIGNERWDTGNQALYISDWWLNTVGQDRLYANIQTTLYAITGDESLPDDKCVIGPKSPTIRTQ